MPQEPNTMVVDASVVLKWQLNDEECTVQAAALRDDFFIHGTISIMAPKLLTYEIANGIVMAARRKRIVTEKALEAISNLLSFGIDYRDVETIEITGLAIRYNLTAYDAAYLALAEKENCDLWTGDKTLYQVLKGRAPRVNWIGDYGS